MTKESYNRIAQQWAEHRHNSFVSRCVVDFANKLPDGGSVLDVGCGTGAPLAKYLSDRGFVVTGIDFSEQMIALANAQKLPNAAFLVCDFFDFRSTKPVDGVLAWDSFFHFPREKQEAIYHKVASLLKPGGYLLFTHGDADDEHVDQMMGESFYYSCLPKDTVCQILIDLGFEVEYVYKDYVENDTDRGLVVLARLK